MAVEPSDVVGGDGELQQLTAAAAAEPNVNGSEGRDEVCGGAPASDPAGAAATEGPGDAGGEGSPRSRLSARRAGRGWAPWGLRSG